MVTFDGVRLRNRDVCGQRDVGRERGSEESAPNGLYTPSCPLQRLKLDWSTVAKGSTARNSGDGNMPTRLPFGHYGLLLCRENYGDYGDCGDASVSLRGSSTRDHGMPYIREELMSFSLRRTQRCQNRFTGWTGSVLPKRISSGLLPRFDGGGGEAGVSKLIET